MIRRPHRRHRCHHRRRRNSPRLATRLATRRHRRRRSRHWRIGGFRCRRRLNRQRRSGSQSRHCPILLRCLGRSRDHCAIAGQASATAAVINATVTSAAATTAGPSGSTCPTTRAKTRLACCCGLTGTSGLAAAVAGTTTAAGDDERDGRRRGDRRPEGKTSREGGQRSECESHHVKRTGKSLREDSGGWHEGRPLLTRISVRDFKILTSRLAVYRLYP
jgi:hypothetical protein